MLLTDAGDVTLRAFFRKLKRGQSVFFGKGFSTRSITCLFSLPADFGQEVESSGGGAEVTAVCESRSEGGRETEAPRRTEAVSPATKRRTAVRVVCPKERAVVRVCGRTAAYGGVLAKVG